MKAELLDWLDDQGLSVEEAIELLEATIYVLIEARNASDV